MNLNGRKRFLLFLLCFVFVTPYIFSKGISQKTFFTTTVLVIDGSGSMQKTDPNFMALEASKLYIDLLGPGDEVAVVFFGGGISPKSTSLLEIKSKQSKSKAKIKKHFKNVYYTFPDTNVIGAVHYAYKLLKTSKAPKKNRKYSIIVLTDGMDRFYHPGKYYEFRIACQRGDINVFPVAIGAALEKQLKELTDESVQKVKKPGDLPSSFAYIFSRIYNSLLTKPQIKGSGYTFGVHPLAKEINLIIADKKQIPLTYQLYDPKKKSFGEKKILKRGGYTANEKFYRSIKITNPAKGKGWTLRIDRTPDEMILIQVPDLVIKVDWGNFSELNKEHIINKAYLLTDGETKHLQNKRFYKDAQFFVVMNGPTTHTARLFDNGVFPDISKNDYYFAGKAQFQEPGQHRYFVQLKHKDFTLNSEAYFVAFRENIKLKLITKKTDITRVKQGNILSFSLIAEPKAALGTRDEIFYIQLQRGAEDGWSTIELVTDEIRLNSSKKEANIMLETSPGWGMDFGLFGTSTGPYKGNLLVSHFGSRPSPIEIEFTVTPQNFFILLIKSLAFWAVIAFIIFIFYGLKKAKRFPGRFYLVDLINNTSQSIKSPWLFRTRRISFGNKGRVEPYESKITNKWKFIPLDEDGREDLSEVEDITMDNVFLTKTNAYWISTSNSISARDDIINQTNLYKQLKKKDRIRSYKII
jgi:hypothetical protein